ncbi:hypothetical protein SNL152K_1804 [Streptomyces sp. NL15-2K]|nr:hypothetical protein SNL152K_1804 [Streptomyces sp. NL15-2K]
MFAPSGGGEFWPGCHGFEHTPVAPDVVVGLDVGTESTGGFVTARGISD